MAKVDVSVNFSGAISATLDVPDEDNDYVIEDARISLYHALVCAVDEGRLRLDNGVALDSVRTVDNLDD